MHERTLFMISVLYGMYLRIAHRDLTLFIAFSHRGKPPQPIMVLVEIIHARRPPITRA